MLWLPTANAGFTVPEAKPWLPLAANWATENAKTQSEAPRSMLGLYRRLLALRRQEKALRNGNISEVKAQGTILRYCRAAQDGTGRLQVLLNLGSEPATVETARGRVVVTTLLDGEGGEVEGPVTVEGRGGPGDCPGQRRRVAAF